MRPSVRNRRKVQRGLENLEPRIVFDAAPYVMEATTVGTMSAYGFDYGLERDEVPRVLFDVTTQHSRTITNNRSVVLGVPYDADGRFEFSLSRGQSSDASASDSISGYVYHTDEELSIGQPETATLYLSGEAFASASISYFLDETGTPITPGRVEGASSAKLVNTTKARIRIWDEDCPVIGMAVRGEWDLASYAGTNPGFVSENQGEATLGQDVTIRYFRANVGSPNLTLSETIQVSIPVGEGAFFQNTVSRQFELTMGSVIEIEVTTNATANSDGSADFNDLQFDLTVEPLHLVDLHDFSHFEDATNQIDPRWMAVEYTMLEPYCYFDLELASQADQGGALNTMERFRITPEIIEESTRFRLLNPDTLEVEPSGKAIEVGRHLLLIDGNSPSLQSSFEDLDRELIAMKEPGRRRSAEPFHGFFHAEPNRSLVIRSDASTPDQVLLSGLDAEFTFGGEKSVYHFGKGEPETSSAPRIVVVTAGEDDLVLASPDFELPVHSRLGNGNDVFVGGAAADVVRGGAGNDALLGEGWEIDVTALKSLFLDMLDMDFTLHAGLIPADGANDILKGEAGNDFLLGGVGNDELDSGPGASIIFGDSLQLTADIHVNIDDLSFAADVDFVRSGAGRDTIVAGDEHTLVIAGGGNDTIIGNSAGTSLLFGNAGNDRIFGGTSFAVIAGGAGDDFIEGSGFLIGDSFTFSTLKNSTFENLKQGKLGIGVELKAEDSGDDTIRGGNGFDFIVGGDGDDLISGGNGLNVVFGDGFDLSLQIGFDFAELFQSSALISILRGPLAVLELFSVNFRLTGEGDDIYNGGNSVDVAFGGAGNDKLFGNAGFDFLVGGDGDDEIDAGDDFFSFEIGDVGFGGPGNDTITGSDGPDHLESEEGNDLFFGLAGDDYIYGGADMDELHGGPGNDMLFGEGGDDKLFGDEGDDVLVGGDGDDILVGGDGNNHLFQETEDRVPGDSNHDGKFDSSDLILVFIAGQYEDSIDGNSTWETGDWNGDGEFDSSDLVFVFREGAYVTNVLPTYVNTLLPAFYDDANRGPKRLVVWKSASPILVDDGNVLISAIRTKPGVM